MYTNRHEWEPGDLNSAAKEEEQKAESGKEKGFLNRKLTKETKVTENQEPRT